MSILAVHKHGVVLAVKYFISPYKAAHEMTIAGHGYHWPESEERKGWECLCEESYYDFDEFTHWMPLPKPPKEKE